MVNKDANGLMPKGSFNNDIAYTKSVRLFTVKSLYRNFTITVLLSGGAYGGARPVSMLLSFFKSESSDTIYAYIQYLSTHRGFIPIKYKKNEDGTYSVYTYRTQYTPPFGCIILSGQSYIQEGLSAVVDNSEIGDTAVDFEVVE